jgi:exodeoxyribonuclease VII small subunit
MESEADVTFEQAMARLEEIVERLDAGDLTLDESLRLFEEGIGLARLCSKQLTDAQGKLEMLVKTADGSVEAQPHEV